MLSRFALRSGQVAVGSKAHAAIAQGQASSVLVQSNFFGPAVVAPKYTSCIRSIHTGNAKLQAGITEPKKAVATAEGQERDLVNFPRQTLPDDIPPVRLGFIPESWFNMLYPKSGVLGPYFLGFGFLNLLISKEFLVVEHELVGGVILGIMLYSVHKYYGPQINDYLLKDAQEENKIVDGLRDDNININETFIKEAEEGIGQAKQFQMLYDAKRENIGLQLEAAYRQRLQQVHGEVKRRLDYQLEVSNVKNRFQQRHMVNWIVDNVRKSITPAQEAASLKQCIGDLKALAARA